MSRILSFFTALFIAFVSAVVCVSPAQAAPNTLLYDCATDSGQLVYNVRDSVTINTQNCDYLFEDGPNGQLLADSGVSGQQALSGLSFTLGVNGFTSAKTLFFDSSSHGSFYLTLHPVQGGSDGVIYFTEKNLGVIYLGEIWATTQTPQTVYWSDAASQVDTIAVTQRRIAWSSQDPTSNMAGKVKISDIGTASGVITTVTIPTSGPAVRITSLTSDLFGERFFLTTSAGDVWSLTSDGLNLTKVFDGSTNLAVKTAVSAVFWGAWYDAYNSNYYFCQYGSAAKVWKATVTGSTMATPTFMTNGPTPVGVNACDGLGIDPFTQTLVAVRASSPYPWTLITSAGVSTEISNFATDSNGVNQVTPARTGAPSSMFVSQSTGKMYFATETNLYETDYATGNNTRVLYTGAGMQNIAVFYGTTAATVNNFTQSLTANSVTFDPGAGVGTMSNQSSNVSTALTSNTFTKSGYTFAGWATSAADASAGTVTYADGASYPFTNSITLYAVWTVSSNNSQNSSNSSNSNNVTAPSPSSGSSSGSQQIISSDLAYTGTPNLAPMALAGAFFVFAGLALVLLTKALRRANQN